MLSLRRLFFAIILGFGLSLSAEVQAQPQQDTFTRPLEISPDFRPPGEIPSLQDILKNIHGSYSVSFMGPRVNGSSNETYNIYLPNVSSIQLYHSFRLGYQVNDNVLMGVGEDIVQNLADGVVLSTGAPYHRSFEWYDPYLYFNFPNLVTVPGWYVFTGASFSLPIGKSSQSAAKITNIVISQTWSINNFPSPWRYGFRLYLNPQFYNDPLPVGFTDRQTLYFSFGHFWGYQFSPLFSLMTSTHFDIEHRSPNPNGFFQFGSSLPDFLQISMNFTPNLFPYFMSFGGYFQQLVWNPSFDTSIIGANFSIGF